MTATAETPVQKATEYDEHGFSDEDKETLAAAEGEAAAAQAAGPESLNAML